MSAEMATADKACLSCHATIAEPEHASEFFWLKGICSKCFPRCKYCLDYLDPVDPPEYFLGVIRSHPAKCWHWRCVPPDDLKKMDPQTHRGHPHAGLATQEPTRKKQYADYLHSPHWRSVREWAIERAANRCQVCNGAERLHVHHRTYERVGAELPSDLIVLCEDCHGIFHRAGKIS